MHQAIIVFLYFSVSMYESAKMCIDFSLNIIFLLR